jgi:hypothetical protein
MLEYSSATGRAQASQVGADAVKHSDNGQPSDASTNPSILRHAIDSVVETVWGGKQSTARNVVEEGLTEFTTAVPLFMGGARAYALTAALYGLNQTKCGDATGNQIEDFALGAAKGLASKTTFDYIGAKTNWNFALKGVVMGASSRAWDVGLTRQTYVGADGNTDVFGGLEKVATTSLNPIALGTDVATFGVAHAASKALGARLSASPMLSSVFTGSTFGFTSGALSEIQREHQSNEGFDFGKVLASAGEQSVIMGGASAAGFKLTAAAHLPQVVRSASASNETTRTQSAPYAVPTDGLNAVKERAQAIWSALGQKVGTAGDIFAGRELGLALASGDVHAADGEVARSIGTATTASEPIADTPLAQRLRRLLVPDHASLIAMDRPDSAVANSAQSTPREKMNDLLDIVADPQGRDLQMAHKFALQLFAQHPELEQSARAAVDRFTAAGAENADIVERLVRVGFKPEHPNLGNLTDNQRDRLDHFLHLGRKLHSGPDFLATRERLFEMLRSGALPDQVVQRLHEQSRNSLLVSTLDEFFGTDYLNSLPLSERQADRLQEFKALQEDQWRQKTENGPSPEVLQARRIHEQKENFISMLKETNFSKVDKDWPGIISDMFKIGSKDRWPPLEPTVVEGVLNNVNTLLTASRAEPDQVRAQILESTALQMVRQAAEPKLTNQSAHPTCTMGSLEYYFWKMFPDEASRLITETVLNNGRFQTTDGTVIKLAKSAIRPEDDSLRVQAPFEYNKYPPRSYASQLFQMITPNIYWQRQPAAPNGFGVPVGSLRYKMTDRGDRLMYEHAGRRLVVSTGPAISTATMLQDVGEQIGGTRTVPNVIEWGTRFKTPDSFARKILSYDGEPVIIAIDHDTWQDRSIPAQNTSHAITIDGVTRNPGLGLYHNTWGEYYDHPVTLGQIYDSLPQQHP